MPQVDVKTPSDDEEFDVTSNSNSDTGTVATEQKAEDMPSLATQADETPAEDAAAEEPAAEEAAPAEPVATSAPAEVADDSTPPPKVAPAAVTAGGVSRPWLHYAVEAVLGVAVVLLALWAWNAHSDNQNLAKQLASVNANPQAVIQKQTDDLIVRVSKLMQLPAGETPTVAAVTDAAAAKQQSAFFANAQNGDKVLMYVKAGEAILYRPSTNKIILVAPLTFNNAAAGATTPKTTR